MLVFVFDVEAVASPKLFFTELVDVVFEKNSFKKLLSAVKRTAADDGLIDVSFLIRIGSISAEAMAFFIPTLSVMLRLAKL